MRLFLSSYRAGRHEDKLLELMGSIKKIGIITNSKDYKSEEERGISVAENLDFWRSLRLKPEEIDLREHFNKPGIEKILTKYDFIWLSGGNVFLLNRALNYSGAGRYLYDAVRKNELILGGESAGAIVMGPTLKYSDVDTDEDSPRRVVPEGYKKEILWQGLDFINYVPVPHYKSAGFIGIDEYIENLKKDRIPYKTMTDDQAIIINGDKEVFLG